MYLEYGKVHYPNSLIQVKTSTSTTKDNSKIKNNNTLHSKVFISIIKGIELLQASISFGKVKFYSEHKTENKAKKKVRL